MTDIYVNPYELRYLSFRLSEKIFDSGFSPRYILVKKQSDMIVGIYVKEYFNFKGVPCEISNEIVKGSSLLIETVFSNSEPSIRTASIFAQPGNTPEYYLKETTHKIILPHELTTLTREEIYEQMGPHIYNILYNLPETISQ